mmetsp:Transcript_49827/g.85283  ORF Transcript_49827/g.85283 Transcript_49827/m.85283 type:complete len:205 (+) Transcript_49827:257-871(+)
MMSLTCPRHHSEESTVGGCVFACTKSLRPLSSSLSSRAITSKRNTSSSRYRSAKLASDSTASLKCSNAASRASKASAREAAALSANAFELEEAPRRASRSASKRFKSPTSRFAATNCPCVCFASPRSLSTVCFTSSSSFNALHSSALRAVAAADESPLSIAASRAFRRISASSCSVSSLRAAASASSSARALSNALCFDSHTPR